MKRILLSAVAATALMLGGCSVALMAGPYALAGDPAAMAGKSDAEIAEAYYTLRAFAPGEPRLDRLKGELDRRGAVRAEYYPAIWDGRIQAGMSELEAIATWGAASKRLDLGAARVELRFYGKRVVFEDGGAVSATPSNLFESSLP